MRRKRRCSKLVLTVVVAASLLALAAGWAAAAAGTPLTGKVWQLASLGGKAPLSGTVISLKLTGDGKLSGSSGCNTYGGTYAAAHGSIRVSPTLVSTRMACAPAVMTQETQYLAALVSARIFGGSRHAYAQKQARQGARVLHGAVAGPRWDVLEGHLLLRRQGARRRPRDTHLTAKFGRDGTVSGFSGCNHYSATFTAKGQRISLGPIASTEMACLEPAGAMAQEAAYTAALESAATYQIENSRLELRNAKGATVVSLRAPEEDPFPRPDRARPRLIRKSQGSLRHVVQSEGAPSHGGGGDESMTARVRATVACVTVAGVLAGGPARMPPRAARRPSRPRSRTRRTR